MPVIASCCGTPTPPDCGCARPITIGSSGIAASTDTITLDGSHTATMPTLSDFPSTFFSDISSCYILSGPTFVSSGTASVNGGATTFPLYLLVWWDDTPAINAAILELGSGSSWTNLAIVFFASMLLAEVITCCHNNATGGNQIDFENSLADIGSINDTFSLTFPPAVGSLFPSNPQTFVIAGTSGTIQGEIQCCPLCFYTNNTSQPDVTVSGDISSFGANGTYSFHHSDTNDNGDCSFVYYKGGTAFRLEVSWSPSTELYSAAIMRSDNSTTGYRGSALPLSCVDGVLTGAVTLPSDPAGSPPTSGAVTAVLG